MYKHQINAFSFNKVYLVKMNGNECIYSILSLLLKLHKGNLSIMQFK